MQTEKMLQHHAMVFGPASSEETELLECFGIARDCLYGGMQTERMLQHRPRAAHSVVHSTARRLATVNGICTGVEEVGVARHRAARNCG